MSVLCGTCQSSRAQSGEAEVKSCMLSTIGMAAREPVEVVPGMRLGYHQGWRRQSQISRWFRGQKAVQETLDPNQFIQVEGIVLGGNIYLYLPLLLICPHFCCQPTLHTDPILISEHPVSLSSYISSPARRSLHYTFITSAVPALQECLLIRCFVIYCVPSRVAAWVVDGKQEHKTHSNGILSSLVTMQRILCLKLTVYSGLCLNSILLCWFIIDLSRYHFFSKEKGNVFHCSNL